MGLLITHPHIKFFHTGLHSLLSLFQAFACVHPVYSHGLSTQLARTTNIDILWVICFALRLLLELRRSQMIFWARRLQSRQQFAHVRVRIYIRSFRIDFPFLPWGILWGRQRSLFPEKFLD